MQFFKEPSIDFLKYRKPAYVLSIALILVGIVSLVMHGGPRYGIDFRGGTEILLEFDSEITIAEVRTALTELGFGNAEIKSSQSLQAEKGKNDILISVEEGEQEGREVAELIKGRLTELYPDKPYEELRVESVGPKIGAELRRAALLAIFISLFFILLYITWRFEFKFAIGAIAALFHDVLITLGIFSLLNIEISLVVVAAFLTIVGYSLNDTIVVFDRIRENLKVMRRETIDRVINVSINQSLSRTVITSMTTLTVLLVLFFFGGVVIHSFAFALIIGVLIGTYSSAFVASPIVVEWEIRSEQKKGRRKLMR
jgi:preprotein translocase SecF subunit